MDKRKIAASVLIALGIGIMGIPAYYKYQGANETDRLLDSFEKTLEVAEDEKMEQKGKDKKSSTGCQEKPAISEENDMEDGAIGIVEIEKLGIRYPIVEGTSVSDLRYAIGHMSDSAGIGERGNCIICGHNGSRYGEYFTNLSKAEVGDRVTVTDRDGDIYKYEIDEAYKTSPKDRRITEHSDEKMLTLFTCADSGKNRFVVKCSLVADSVQRGGDVNDI